MSNRKLCVNCGAVMTKPLNYSYKQWLSKKYCSAKCGVTSPLHINPFIKGHRHSEETKEKLALQKIGSKNPRWKGGRNYDGHGYIKIQIAPNEYRLEHRVIMEKRLGRRLDKFEHVHHINGIKDDNRVENLIVLMKAEHHKLHRPKGSKRLIKNVRIS